MEWHKEEIDGKNVWRCQTNNWDFLIEYIDENNSMLWSNNYSCKRLIQTGNVKQLFYYAFDLELGYKRKKGILNTQ